MNSTSGIKNVPRGLFFPNEVQLDQPNAHVLLYKIVNIDDFIDMIKNNYLYFKRVDTYRDDCRDSDIPDHDQPIAEKEYFQDSNHNLLNYYRNFRERSYACCFTLKHTPYIWRHYGSNNKDAICIVFNYNKFLQYIRNNGLQVTLNNKRYSFFNLNGGLVKYGSLINESLIKNNNSYLTNPIHHIYFKDVKYKNEHEYRLSLSFPIGGYVNIIDKDNKKSLDFPNSVKFEFDFTLADTFKVINKIYFRKEFLQSNKNKLESLLYQMKLKSFSISEICWQDWLLMCLKEKLRLS